MGCSTLTTTQNKGKNAVVTTSQDCYKGFLRMARDDVGHRGYSGPQKLLRFVKLSDGSTVDIELGSSEEGPGLQKTSVLGMVALG